MHSVTLAMALENGELESLSGPMLLSQCIGEKTKAQGRLRASVNSHDCDS